MKYKPDKEKKIINGRIVECIVEGCYDPAYIYGLCWKHSDQEKKEEEE